jgi:hypothetical protein
MIFSENRHPLFGDLLSSETRLPDVLAGAGSSPLARSVKGALVEASPSRRESTTAIEPITSENRKHMNQRDGSGGPRRFANGYGER